MGGLHREVLHKSCGVCWHAGICLSGPNTSVALRDPEVEIVVSTTGTQYRCARLVGGDPHAAFDRVFFTESALFLA